MFLAAVIIIADEKITTFSFVQKDIPTFSVDDVEFDPFPLTINIENQYDCNAKNLKLCDINDPTTLFGCKELIVKCHHFEKDTEFINNNESTIIPKNKSPTEGYALAITTISESCNPYHGDLTLVTANAESNEYMLICTCKNPGYIGNDDLLGNCTTVYICNGQIDDIDKPLKNINCICDSRQKNVRYDDGLPVCKNLTVREANEMFSDDDWSNIVPWNSNRQIATSDFNKTIAGNLKTSRLLDPCRNSLHDTTIEIPNARYDSSNGTCMLKSYGFPVSNGLLDFRAANSEPDIPGVSVDAVLATGEYESVRVCDNIAGVRRITGIIVSGLPFSDDMKNTPVVLAPKAGIGFNNTSQIGIIAKPKNFIAPKCTGFWPTYECILDNYYGSTYNGLPFPGSRGCPNAFLWGTDSWNNAERMVANGVKKNNRGLTFDNSAFSKVSHIKPYGIQWVSTSSKQSNGVLEFLEQYDYNIHKKVLT